MKPPPSLRLFLALYPSQPWVDAAAACLPIAQLPEGRSTPSEQLHLTLAFVGDRRESDLPRIVESMQAAVTGLRTFDVQTTGLSLLPESGPPRMIAAKLTLPPALFEVQKRLSRRLVSERANKRDDYTPHITLFRFAHEQQSPDARASLEAVLPPVYLPTFRASEVCLVASVLHPLGARHKVVERVAVG
jgi:RNA 2',3'-cyclic 3'-phosphodiesterase